MEYSIPQHMFTQYMTLFHSLFNSLSQAHSSTTTMAWVCTASQASTYNQHDWDRRFIYASTRYAKQLPGTATLHCIKGHIDYYGPFGYNPNGGFSCSTCNRNAPSSKPSVTNGCLGKRSADVSSQTDKVVEKKARIRGVVQDTVLNMMEKWYLEENWILEDDCAKMQATLDSQAKEIAALKRQLIRKDQQQHLHAIQLNACHRYSRMVETWCPQVREMFNGDLDSMLEIQREQQWDLEMEWDHQDRLFNDQEETEDEE